VAGPKEKRKTRKVKKKLEINGVAHVKSSFNNTIITMTDVGGNVITWSSGGHQGRYKGSRKSTAFAAQLAARHCAQEVLNGGMRKIEIWVRGPGSGREAAIRTIKAEGLEVTRIKDVTRIPHNGCRPSKRRR
jgi:small subunit ribosomal protein S11